MKQWKSLLGLFLLILLSVQSQISAKLVLEGIAAVELIADPKGYDPLEGRNEIIPGVYSMDITKIGIAIRSDDETNRIRAYFPYLLNASYVDNNKYISVGSMTPAEWWDSYFGSNYYFVAQGNPFTVGLSNRRIYEDEDYSFFSFNDALGAFAAPNSDYPMITVKLGGDFLNTKVEAYKIYDSKVSFLPAHEHLPAQIQSIELKPGFTIGSYPYLEELADYTLLKLSRPFGDYKVSFLYGDKQVNNPGFMTQAENTPDYYKPDSARRLGVYKQNYGVEFARKWGSGVEAIGEYLTSTGQWREYSGTYIVDGRSMPRWEILGETGGTARHFTFSGLKLKELQLGGYYQAVDPDFQMVAQRHPHYSYGVYNEVMGDIKTPLLLRATYDPKVRYGRGTPTSLVSQYLGFESRGLNFKLPGQIVGNPSVLKIEAVENRSLDGNYQRQEIDFNTGELLIKDHRQLDAELSIELNQSHLIASSTVRNYFADWNYLTRLGLKWVKNGEKINNSLSLEQYSRLRDYQWAEGDQNASLTKEGNLSCLVWELEGTPTRGLILNAKLDLRDGTYEKDLTQITEDRVLASPYQVIITNLFAKKEIDWMTAKGPANLTLAAEVYGMKGNAAATLLEAYLGVGSIGYVGLNYPLFKDVNQQIMLLNVNGSQQENFPGRFVKTTFHHEMQYQPTNGGSKFRVGYSLRPLEDEIKKNLYATIGGRAGGGNWSLTYGFGTLREFTEPEYLLPGQWRHDNPYVPLEVLGRPWEAWDDSNIAFGNEQTVKQISMRFWYSF